MAKYNRSINISYVCKHKKPFFMYAYGLFTVYSRLVLNIFDKNQQSRLQRAAIKAVEAGKR